MTDDHNVLGGQTTGGDDLVEIDLNFESMRRFQAEFSPNLSKGGLFIDTGEPLSPGSVVRFRVILPEEFVFLEGTSVVEWIRGAESICDGAPGMALRFVTLSSQNQELVEQLVQDFIDTGGTPFDLDVRPVPADFPTDSLEGAPAPSTDNLDEGYRLTVRHTGPGLQADALRALTAAVPTDDENDLRSGAEDREAPEASGADDGVSAVSVGMEPGGIEDPAPVDEEAAAVDEVHGFEIISNVAAEVGPADEEMVAEVEAAPTVEEAVAELEAIPRVDETRAEVDEVSAVQETVAEVKATGEPPELDWSAEATMPSESDEITAVEAVETVMETVVDPHEDYEEMVVAEQEELSFSIDDDRQTAEGDELPLNEDVVEMPEVLTPPSAFDEGPEVIEDVGDGDLGSPAFEVSLPEHDDEPDTTPVLPDEGLDEVTVATDDDFEEPPDRRRRWPLALVALVVLAVGGGFLWPHARGWLASRDEAPSQEPASVETTRVVEDAEGPAADQLPDDQTEIPQASEAVAEAAADGDDGEAVVVETEEPEAEVEDVVEDLTPEPAPAAVELASADAVTAVDVEQAQSGTVIRIRANGSLEDGVLSMETLSSPPRVLIRVRGITNSYRPYTIEAMTPEVTQVRSGLHEERRPSELWIVVDLAEPDVSVGGVSIGRDLAELMLKRP